jgi:hypothetical protein
MNGGVVEVLLAEASVQVVFDDDTRGGDSNGR